MTNLRHHIWRVKSPFWSRSRRIECALMRAPPGGLEGWGIRGVAINNETFAVIQF